MEIHKKKQNEWLELRVSGRLDASQAGYLETELEETIRSGDHRIRLLLGGVTFLSSAGIRILVKYFQALKRLGGCLVVAAPSPEVRGVLDMTGLSATLLSACAEAASGPELIPKDAGAEKRSLGTLQAAVFQVEPGAALSCRLVGEPSRIADASFGPEDCVTLKLSKTTLALGLGAFGSGSEDLRNCFGEFLAAAGSAVYLPTGKGPHVPDYMLTQGALVPEIRTLYAVVCEGAFSRCVRFEAGASEPAAPLSKIIEALFEIEKSQTIGWVMIAESAGLIGASLKKSPDLGLHAPEDPVFSHPLIRDWISFTPEHAYPRALVLAAGIAVSSAGPELLPFVRPLRKGGDLMAHVHAAAFDFRVLPQGPLPLEETAGSLFRDGKILGLLHLVNDDREITGSGESIFTRGAVWFSPVKNIARDSRP